MIKKRYILEHPYYLRVLKKDEKYSCTIINYYSYTEKLVIIKNDGFDGTFSISIFHKGWCVVSMSGVVSVERFSYTGPNRDNVYEKIEWETVEGEFLDIVEVK